MADEDQPWLQLHGQLHGRLFVERRIEMLVWNGNRQDLVDPFQRQVGMVKGRVMSDHSD
ncbi:hypothetical protein D9M69_711100 [compost metagenome]